MLPAPRTATVLISSRSMLTIPIRTRFNVSPRMMETTLPFTDGYKVLYHCNGNGCPWNSDSAKNRSKSATRFADSPKTRSSPTQRSTTAKRSSPRDRRRGRRDGPSRYLDPDGVRRCRLLDPRVGAHRRGTVLPRRRDRAVDHGLLVRYRGHQRVRDRRPEGALPQAVATGEKISGAAISEPDTGSDVSRPSRRAPRRTATSG